ncbi:hypothetical protein C7974DRAFT_440205 [Boeremia exigua]|uniref:uncharacterized protein n=1 Tax=Boeremia exigua TaxID=749465 RepID=UPI001E8DD5E4|nr:uncharacterized protein C7974DRAFT_440205 [Boeremia exigua]KAH6644661.1 hypothetical protein C7974DRAFT_440205 [Boeremia exigua]
MPSGQGDYINIPDGKAGDHERVPWYWRFIAMTASWMVLGGYLILPGLYAKNAELRFSTARGYSFTALLCFACRNDEFQAENVFVPALASSIFGLVVILYNFLATNSYDWSTAATSATVLSGFATVLYGGLLWWKRRIIARRRKSASQRSNLYSEQSFYTNYIPNMYPTAIRTESQPPPPLPGNDDDPVNQQMRLLMLRDARPSPDANSSTFRIDLPEDTEQRERHERSQELVGTPQQSHTPWTRDRANSRPDSLGENQAWRQLQDRGRPQHRPSSSDLRSNHSRGLSREERRREIELGQV